MANPSWASFGTRSARLLRDVKAIRSELSPEGLPQTTAHAMQIQERAVAAVTESRKLDEIRDYLWGRTGPEETLKQWRERNRTPLPFTTEDR